MHVNKIQNNPSFGAVHISQHVKQNLKLTETIIDSPVVREYIAKNEAMNLDTFIRFERSCPINKPDFYIKSSDSKKSKPLIKEEFETYKGIINVINYMDRAKRLPEKMKNFEDWVKSIDTHS